MRASATLSWRHGVALHEARSYLVMNWVIGELLYKSATVITVHHGHSDGSADSNSMAESSCHSKQ